jgi:hypothetical protein
MALAQKKLSDPNSTITSIPVFLLTRSRIG